MSSIQIQYKKNGGAAMMILVIFFMFITLSILVGIVTPVVREFRVASDNLKSKQSYFITESGIEDALFRIKNNKQIGASEMMVLGTSTATTTITNISGSQKQISALGDTNLRQRKIDLVVSTSTGVSFNYGVQVGNGGLVMSNNSQVVGNIYSNGDITGSGSVTGTAIAANSSALSADQINNTPVVPPSSISIRNTTNTQDFAQSFQLSTAGPINKLQFYIKKVGSPANATVRIVTNSSGSPGTNNLLATQGTLSASLVTTAYGWIEVALPDNPNLLANTTYWVVIDNSSTSSSNYYIIGANNTTYTNGTAKSGVYNGTWNATSPATLDSYFQVYLGGLTGEIKGITVGSSGSGDAWAHTIIGGSVAGTKYCQVGTGCNTTRADPTATAFPISDANIQSWKDDAVTGGTITGNYSVSGTTSLGPKKITGNLTISGTLTITGTLWVQGNIYISNNATVKLSSSYGSSSGLLVADGYVDMSNNVTYLGSGTSGSYIMLITTSDCPTSSSCGGNYAINISNNVDAVILVAQNGTVYFNNNANANEVTAYKMVMNNNSVVTYLSGLADLNFSSGPSGSWSISSWKETQ